MNWRSTVLSGVALCLSACAAYDGYPLKPGVSTQDEVRAVMGVPSLTWQDEAGQQWAYPRGPAGGCIPIWCTWGRMDESCVSRMY